MSPSYRILVTCVDAFGHINPTIGFGEILAAQGHKVVFAHHGKYKYLADQRGFEFIAFDESLFPSSGGDGQKFLIQTMSEMCKKEPLERFQSFTIGGKMLFGGMAKAYSKLNEALEKILQDNDFDLIVGDLVVPFPCMYKTKIPFVPLTPMSPLILYPNGPPAFSGYSVDSDKSTWPEFRQAYAEAMSLQKESMNKWLQDNGLPAFFDPLLTLDTPKHVGFYLYPEDLDYSECGPVRENWTRIDVSIRQPDSSKVFQIPEVLVDKPGALIYFSLGSMASADLELMQKLLDILSKSPHRFIVSEGRLSDKLKLGDNMWGEDYVDQMGVLQVVDLVITHGGNNTLLETLYFGRPMIVVPYFFDQLDNAQRVVDKKLGYRIDPWALNEDYLLKCIDSLAKDDELKERVQKVSQNMRNAESRRKAVELIEKVIEKSKKERGEP